jgi:hypothetical protein
MLVAGFHSEIKASATLEGTCDVPSSGEVANDDLGTHGSQRVGTFVLAMNQCSDGQVALAKQLHNSAAHTTHIAGRASDENRITDRHDC